MPDSKFYRENILQNGSGQESPYPLLKHKSLYWINYPCHL